MSNVFIDPYVTAAKLKMEVILPKENELFIDIDSEESLEQYERSLMMLQYDYAFIETKRTPSKTRGHYHIIVQVDDFVPTDLERWFFQACLGSDLSRELMSWIAKRKGITHPQTVFFEKKVD